MTSEELKGTLPMRQVIESYGVKVNRQGMCNCPIHGEKHPSMKVYAQSFNCFACGANGDIFSFVMAMDKCDFKTAFISLGGTYKQMSDRERKLAEVERERKAKERQQAKEREASYRKLILECFDLIEKVKKEEQPYSDKWCLALGFEPMLNDYWESFLDRKEIDTSVYRRCSLFRQRLNSV